MRPSILVVVFIALGAFFAFKLRGAASRRSLKLYAISVVLIVLGGGGFQLDLETSANSTFRILFGPSVFVLLFVLGILLLSVNSLLNILAWRRTMFQPDSRNFLEHGQAHDPDNTSPTKSVAPDKQA